MSKKEKLTIDNIFNVGDMMPKSISDRSRIDNDSKRKKESSKIKDTDWEKVKPSKSIGQMENLTAYDLRTAVPSRASVEHNNGGTGSLVQEKIIKPKYDFSDSIIKESKERKEKRDNRHKRPIESRGEWEQVTKAKTTADVQAGNMGFTPNKSAFSMKEIPKVKVDVIENQKRLSEQSKIAGIQAAKMKNDLDAIMQKSMQEKMSGDWSWEKEAQEEIHGAINKQINVNQGTKLSDNMIYKKANTDNDLSGLFSDNVPNIKEKDIKRDSSGIKGKRKSRQDDRSWEKVEVKKLGKF